VSTIKVDTIQTRGGASEIAIDKLKGASSAGSMTVVGEGGSTTTNLQQGLCKMWIRLNGTGTIAIDDSFNVGSATDIGTGNYDFTFSNNMNNANFNFAHASGNQMQIHSAEATSSIRILCRNGSNSDEDVDPACSNIHGDLA